MELLETKVSLHDMHFYAYHGALPLERIVGGRYTISLVMHVGCADAALYEDRLSGTVSYADAYRLVAEVMRTPSDLLEHVAGRILRSLFLHFRRVTEAEVTVCKDNPPMGADCRGAAVTLRARNALSGRKRLLILDFDGTLADTSAGIVRTMRATFAEMGYAQPAEEAIRQTIGLPLRESIVRLARPATDAEADRAADVYRRLFEEIGAQAVTAFPGVEKTLRHLSAQGVGMAVATSRGHESVVALCRSIGIAPYIMHYVANEDVAEKKPAPEAVNKLLALFSARPEEALVVGDTSYDIRMGRAAGCATCGVGYGNHSREALIAAGADGVADTFGEIMRFFGAV